MYTGGKGSNFRRNNTIYSTKIFVLKQRLKSSTPIFCRIPMSFYLVLASCTSILYTKSIAVIHADYQVEIKEIICCDRPRTMHQLTAPPGSMGTHNAGALSTQETPCLFAPHPPAQTYHHVNVPHCLGLDATKIEAMFGTAKKHGAIRRAFSCKDLKKILSVNLTALRVDIFAFVRRYLRPRL